jgi:hypothetical protein
MDQLSGALIVIGVLGFVALLIKWAGMGKYAELQRLHETQKQILDKIGSGPEMIQFVESKEGKEFFERLKMPSQPAFPQARRNTTLLSALNAVNQTIGFGLVAAGVGIGLLVTYFFYRTVEILMWGCILFCCGIGLVITSRIAYRQYKKWGVIKEDAEMDTGSKEL